MRFLLDESAEFRLAAWLQHRGHDVTAIAHDYPHALSDTAVLALAAQEKRILITNDRDFGELIFRHRLPHAGVIYFRIPSGRLAEKQTWLEHVLDTYRDDIEGNFIVITDQGVRLRRLKA